MPKFKKQIISRYIKTDCKRFLALELYRDIADKDLASKYNMPEPIVARPTATIFAKAGVKAEKLLYDLILNEFGNEYSIMFDKTLKSKERLIELFNNSLENKLFLLEPEFLTDDLLEEFINQFGETLKNFKDALTISDIRPDIIAVVKPNDYEIYYEVKKDGSLERINDDRILLSIIDIKNTEKSNSGYDAEVILYSILLTIWLEKNNLSNKYAVCSKSGIFPASLKVNPFSEEYEPLNSTEINEKYNELLSYVEYVEHDQLVITLRNIIINDLIPILKKPETWKELEWHVGKKCGLCDWLAYEDWLSNDNKNKITDQHCHCHALNIDHLSQIPFLSNAMRKVLTSSNLDTMSKIELTDGSEDTYKKHSKLKVNSTLIPKRANSIKNNSVSYEDKYIYSMPKFSLTNIFITLNFDPSTRIVSSISTKCYWKEFANYFKEEEKRKYTSNKSFPTNTFFTETGDVKSEREMLFYFLNQVNEYFEYANDKKNNPHPNFQTSTYHMYFWDRTQYEELKKLIGKHIGIILEHKLLKSLIWLFGSEEILEDYRTIKSPNVTFIKDIIKANIALNVRFDYTLFQVAFAYTTFDKKISKAFYDPFSDYIPKERLYEIWLKVKKPNYQEIRNLYMLTAKSQVDALQMIAVQLTKDLQGLIKGEANEINFKVFDDFIGIKNLPIDSKLWYLHHRLNEEYAFLSNELDLFKNIDDLEANYKAIVLTPIEDENVRTKWLESVGKSHIKDLLVYSVSEDSCNTKIKDDSTSLSLGIYDDISFISKKFSSLCIENGIYDEFSWYIKNKKIHEIVKVKINHFDRVNGMLIIEFTAFNEEIKNAILTLIRNDVLNISVKLYLLEINSYPGSYHTLGYIKAIKTPLISKASENTLKALGLTKDKIGSKSSPLTMSAEVLWDANNLQNKNSCFTETMINASYEIAIEDMENKPNKNQKEAIYNALSKRLSIIWGPPGIGKTNTASILVKTLLLMLQDNNLNKNILLSAFTYQACIELFDKIYFQLDKRFENVEFIIISSKNRRKEFDDFISRSHLWNIDIKIVEQREDYLLYKKYLEFNIEKIKVVISPIAALNGFNNDNSDSGAPKKCKYENIGKYFDYALLDEASQCDVSNSLGVLYGLKPNSQLVILGDHLQMPPIHQVKPPLHIEYNVGSFLDYLRKRHNVIPKMLNVNYRSTKNIVDYIKTLGYKDLESSKGSASFTINDDVIILNPYKSNFKNEELFTNILKPEYEVISITHYDDLSSQANAFEAELVASTIIEAYNSFYNNQNIELYSKHFWEKEIGVVTPHKAQKVMISKLLYKIFPNDKQYIDNAIDTVEKFQGSQRKFIIVSFGVGDPDIIRQEEEFLLNLNRTNVAISRAEEKILIIISEKLVHHLPDDKEVIKTSKAIKSFVYQYCSNKKIYTVKYDSDEKIINYRYK